MSLTVRTHVERKRVSYENRPVGSVFEASMSPRSSLTTNVLPSRIRTRVAAIAQLLRLPTDRSPEVSGMPTGAGNRRWTRTSSRGSPSISRAPRRNEAMAFVLAGRDLVERVLLDADDAVGATRRPARRPTCHRRCPAASGRSDRRRRCRTGWSPSCCRAAAPGRVSRGPRRSRLSRLASRPPSAPPSNTMTFLLERGARRGAAGGCPIGGLWSIEPAGLRPWIRLIYQTSVNAEGAMSRVVAGGPTSCTPRPGPAPRESG